MCCKNQNSRFHARWEALFFLLLMQRGAAISHFFNPSELKRPIFTSCKIRSGGLPAAQSSVARALFCLAPSSGLVAAFVFLSPSVVHGSCAEKRFVYLTSWDLGREGNLRAAALHVKVPPGTAKISAEE